jgi:nicotinate-nucleotide adenylyltransferase
MKIGLYFGSFNPIHHGHLIIAMHVLEQSKLDQVWFMVSPLNPFKLQTSLLNEYDRLHLVRLAIENQPELKAMDTEFRLPRPSYTIHTLQYLEEKYPLNEDQIILGSDGFQNLDKWKNAPLLMDRYPFLVYIRPGFPPRTDLPVKTTLLQAPLLDISSTYIRQRIKLKYSIKYLVPDNVMHYIDENNYYR